MAPPFLFFLVFLIQNSPVSSNLLGEVMLVFCIQLYPPHCSHPAVLLIVPVHILYHGHSCAYRFVKSTSLQLEQFRGIPFYFGHRGAVVVGDGLHLLGSIHEEIAPLLEYFANHMVIFLDEGIEHLVRAILQVHHHLLVVFGYHIVIHYNLAFYECNILVGHSVFNECLPFLFEWVVLFCFCCFLLLQRG